MSSKEIPKIPRRTILTGGLSLAGGLILGGCEQEASGAGEANSPYSTPAESIVTKTEGRGKLLVTTPTPEEQTNNTKTQETEGARKVKVEGIILNNEFFEKLIKAGVGAGSVEKGSPAEYAAKLWGEDNLSKFTTNPGIIKLYTAEALRQEKEGLVELNSLFATPTNSAIWVKKLPENTPDLAIPQTDSEIPAGAKVVVWATFQDRDNIQKTLIAYTQKVKETGEERLRFAFIPTFKTQKEEAKASLQKLAEITNTAFIPTPSNIVLQKDIQDTTHIWGTNVLTLSLADQIREEMQTKDVVIWPREKILEAQKRVWQEQRKLLVFLIPLPIKAEDYGKGEIVKDEISNYPIYRRKSLIALRNFPPNTEIVSPITGEITLVGAFGTSPDNIEGQLIVIRETQTGLLFDIVLPPTVMPVFKFRREGVVVNIGDTIAVLDGTKIKPSYTPIGSQLEIGTEFYSPIATDLLLDEYSRYVAVR